jgi:sulfotransferase
MKLHFISGLPRAGSTLLSAVLRQNPRFHADVSSPVKGLVSTLMPSLSEQEFEPVMDDGFRQRALRGLFEAYHGQRPEPVVFDTNRLWTGHLPLLGELFAGSRVICCVRDIGWVLDSVERMLALNPSRMSSIFRFQRLDTVYQRVELMMNPGDGFVGLPLTNLREAWFSRFAQALVVVPYEHLTAQPERTVRALYEALGEPWFAHDFEALDFDSPERDARLGMPGLHHVHPRLEAQLRTPGIPPDLFSRFVAAQFWQQPNQNPHGVMVL